MSLIPHHTSDPICALCEEKLELAHPYLQNWFRTLIKPKLTNAHVSWTYRDKLNQELAYNENKSKLHFPNSAHNKTPALAIDLFEINEKGQAAWDKLFFEQAHALCEGTPIVWGGGFTSLGDFDHFEYRGDHLQGTS